MEEKYLVMVTAANNNKYYHMIPDEDGLSWRAEYGRIGVTTSVAHYLASEFDKKYREKIRKGYVDQTDLHASTKVVVNKIAETENTAPISDKEVAELVDMMIRWAQKTIAENYTVSSKDVNKKAINKAQAILDSMAGITTVKDFNNALLELFNVIPRRMNEVCNYLAGSKNDFATILSDEQSLLDTMASQIPDEEEIVEKDTTSHKRGRKSKKTILDKNNLEIYPCTPQQTESVKRHLDHRTRPKFVRAWRAKNTKTFANFEKYCKQHNIGEDGIKFYYHGSRNENDWGITKYGLKLRPSQAVVRTGAMFGHGHYFASVADKSVGYTSLTNSYWAHGSSSTSLLFVFRVAQGKTYDLDKWSSEVSNWHEEDCRKAGYDSVYAHAGKDLRRDEIIVYNDAACTLEYIIELKNED